MRLEINSGGLDSFFNGVSSFVSSGINTANSNNLIGSFQSIVNKTNNLSGGVGTLSLGLGYIQTRKTAEESRKIAIDNVKRNADGFILTALRVDTEVATAVSRSQDEFYKINPWLRPPTPLSAALDRLWSGGAEVWKGIVSFVKEHWKEILIGLAAIAIGALLTFLTGGAFLPALLAGLKVATIAGLISGGIGVSISATGSIINGESFGDALGNALNAFGDGFASGFMIGGIMAGSSQIISGGFKIAAKLGAQTGRSGGIGKEGIFKILSPDKIASDGNSGGTIFKIGKTFRFDVDSRILQGSKYINPHNLGNFLHMHLPGVTGNIPKLFIVGGHIPIGMYGSGLFGALRNEFGW